ncbi:hypothetical protein [Hyphococcus luteus]|jgi:hypothetical protein|uniref:Lipoprotein SmpA/OmlA domain-containing protein n=1 Tax=Hyphococcus luteus TaxID=2058213 RepID=A0A2S7K6X3_9PROT|nr:hypothetical protein [Marinicaulis flavus]PQA88208.1 hypothetical protein CW354_07840 [Marinicaulis flavus]
MRFRHCAFFGLFSLAAACASAPESAEAPVTAPPAPAEPVYRLADILGARASAIDEMFGAPALTRKEGAGEYRRYALTTCTLILILYPDETGVSKVAHVDATATHSAGEKPDLEDCLAAG